MRISPSQLIPGCILLKDVVGKTNQPIVIKNTVLTEEHIVILQKFLVEFVEVSAMLENGGTFKPKPAVIADKYQVKNHREKQFISFSEHYQLAVLSYEKIFKEWQNGRAIDMQKVRKLLLPLLKRIDEIGSAVFTVHNYSAKEKYFYHHGIAVALLSAFIGKQIGFGKEESLQIGIAGFLSDSGMAKIAPKNSLENNSLTIMEREEIKKHPTHSYRFIEHAATVTYAVKLAVLQHHERLDGSGYPFGLSREKIHMYARIIAVCDLYHALTSERPYKERQSPFKAVEKIEREQFTKLDPEVVRTFINSLTSFLIGTKVKLSNGQCGEIVFMEAKKPSRPMVKVDGTKEIISLQNTGDLHIEKVLKS